MQIDPSELSWVPVEDNWWSLRYGGVEFIQIFMFARSKSRRSDDDLRREAATLLKMKLENLSNHQRMEVWLAGERARRLRALQAAIDEGFASGESPSSVDEIRAEALGRHEALAISPEALELGRDVAGDHNAALKESDHGHE